jgi:hypothetical protein
VACSPALDLWSLRMTPLTSELCGVSDMCVGGVFWRLSGCVVTSSLRILHAVTRLTGDSPGSQRDQGNHGNQSNHGNKCSLGILLSPSRAATHVGFHVRCPLMISDFNQSGKCVQVVIKLPSMKWNEIHSAGLVLLHVDRRTDRAKLYSRRSSASFSYKRA